MSRNYGAQGMFTPEPSFGLRDDDEDEGMKNVGGVSLATRFDFGLAIHAMKSGERVRRAGWNGKGMWICLVTPEDTRVRYKTNGNIDFSTIPLLPWIGMLTVDGSLVPWLASQTDMLAADWEIVE